MRETHRDARREKREKIAKYIKKLQYTVMNVN